ncbi:hypothetical protein LINGRAHAP2_LOCUS19330 [Linum grandiflorum]
MGSGSRAISIFPVLLCLVILMFASGTRCKETCIGDCEAPSKGCDSLCTTQKCEDACQSKFQTNGFCEQRIGSKTLPHCCCNT